MLEHETHRHIAGQNEHGKNESTTHKLSIPRFAESNVQIVETDEWRQRLNKILNIKNYADKKCNTKFKWSNIFDLLQIAFQCNGKMSNKQKKKYSNLFIRKNSSKIVSSVVYINGQVKTRLMGFPTNVKSALTTPYFFICTTKVIHQQKWRLIQVNKMEILAQFNDEVKFLFCRKIIRFSVNSTSREKKPLICAETINAIDSILMKSTK